MESVRSALRRVRRRETKREAFNALVAAERQRQVDLGYTLEHDIRHGPGHLIRWALDNVFRGRRVQAAAMLWALDHVLREQAVREVKSASTPEPADAEIIRQLHRYLERFNGGRDCVTNSQRATVQAVTNILGGAEVAWAASDREASRG